MPPTMAPLARLRVVLPLSGDRPARLPFSPSSGALVLSSLLGPLLCCLQSGLPFGLRNLTPFQYCLDRGAQPQSLILKALPKPSILSRHLVVFTHVKHHRPTGTAG